MSSIQSSSDSLTQLSATELARLIRQKQISPVELVEAHLQRIEECNPRINAFTYVNADQAKAEAKRVEAEVMSGETPRPLLGVPITIKACIDVKGMRCEAGSRLRKDYVAEEDAPLVVRLRQAGAIVIGNTNTPELLI